MQKVLDIIYEDNDILVINKPPGILVHSDKKDIGITLIDLILEKYPQLKNIGENLERPAIVHRLDKETSGILIAAKNQKSYEFFKNQFLKREVIKKYLVLVEGRISQEKGIIRTFVGKDRNAPIFQKAVKKTEEKKVFNPKEAITRYKILKRLKNELGNDFTLVEAEPKTGRTHQLRIHFQYLKKPIVGDFKYGAKEKIYYLPAEYPAATCRGDEYGAQIINPALRGGVDNRAACGAVIHSRMFLHAYFLKIRLLDGKEKEFSASLPSELKLYLSNLKEIV